MSKSLQEREEEYMRECLILAKKGAGYVSPNPMVGAIIVKDGKIIGRGFHARYGEPHAEVNAIRNTKEKVNDATLFINLEPCNFTGKTPPCTDLIISSKIKRVVIGMTDPNPAVSGKGIRILRKEGIKVELGVLEDECRKLNRAFTKFITTHLPYVTLKIAQTLDGKIADCKGNSQWISDATSRSLTHRLRAEYDAVLVGAETVRKDNPFLTVRNVKGRNPKRVIINPALDIPIDANVFSDVTPGSVFLFADSKYVTKKERIIKILSARGVKIFFLNPGSDGKFAIKDILLLLGKNLIASVLVEGGASTLGRFIQEKAADHLMLFIAPKLLGSGLASVLMTPERLLGNEVNLHNLSAANLENDILLEGYFKG
ncbi:MAG: bifunctional diaminohydroxyphosphoribosylaminopyrimidine deaminase/5-amino-6-(5-phosphoribosylamino)uracil reductase RibD [Bacteroidota bacterium]